MRLLIAAAVASRWVIGTPGRLLDLAEAGLSVSGAGLDLGAVQVKRAGRSNRLVKLGRLIGWSNGRVKQTGETGGSNRLVKHWRAEAAPEPAPTPAPCGFAGEVW